MDARTKGPQVNQYMETTVPGLFSCGNALHVNDLVDYVSESGSIAGERAALLCSGTPFEGNAAEGRTATEYCSPELARIEPFATEMQPAALRKTLLKFRSAQIKRSCIKPPPASHRMENRRCCTSALQHSGEHAVLTITAETKQTQQFSSKTYRSLKPPEMERIIMETASIPAYTQRLSVSLTNAEPAYRAKEAE